MTKQSKWLMRGVILLLILTIIWMLYQTSFILQPVVIIIRAIALPFIVAGVGFYLLRPIIRWAEQKGVKRLYSITIMIEGNVITPHIIGRKLEVHPLTIISCFCLPEVCQV